jgi:toxin ParE1/3/4
MAKLRFTNKAVEDFTSIWNYTFKTWSERQADEYYEMLISACRRTLVSSLVPARLYAEISPDLYGVKAGHHLIFFKTITDGDVLIVRILHERMDIKRHLKEDAD